MKPLSLTEVNQDINEIPKIYEERVQGYGPNVICGAVVDWEDQLGIEKRYVALYENKFVLFLEDKNFLEEEYIEIPLENIKAFKPGRAKGIRKKNKIYEIEIFWELNRTYIEEFNSKKQSGEQFINNLDDLKLTSSAAVVEQMLGLKDTCAILLLGEIKGSGRFNSFGLVALELMNRASKFDLRF